MTPRKSEWMELADSDSSTRDVRKIDKRLTFGTLATVSAIILGGSLFANANDEPVANAEVSVTSSPTAASASSTPLATKTVTAKAVATKTPKSPTPAIAATNIKPPAIASLPKGGDDEGYENEGREGRNKHRDSEYDDEEDDD
ncbi:MAG: hypothetical protein NTY85_00690 [Actinobacteria bacterium]|nr:hypothetical protein [Actinomycetota bacterium]